MSVKVFPTTLLSCEPFLLRLFTLISSVMRNLRVSIHSLLFSRDTQCKEALSTRQKLIAQDYKVSYSLAKACKQDLRKYRCNVDTTLPRGREAKLSYLLLCLESAVQRGRPTKKDMPYRHPKNFFFKISIHLSDALKC